MPSCADGDMQTSRSSVFAKAKHKGFGVKETVSNSHNSWSSTGGQDLELKDKDPLLEVWNFP